MKRVLMMLLCLALLSGCGGRGEEPAGTRREDSVIIAMGPTSEPEAGFDPAYGWGAGVLVH